MIDGMIEFSENKKTKKLMLLIMAFTMDNSDVNYLRSIFLNIDIKGQGTLSYDQFHTAIELVDADLNDDKILKMFTAIDQDQSGHIHCNEWVASLIECQGFLTTERLVDVFDRFDSDSKGYITEIDIKHILGFDFDEKTVESIAKECGIDTEGKVSILIKV